MSLKNTYENYGWLAKLLHWVIAILIIGMLAVGLYMSDLPHGLQKLKLLGWHKEFGILILSLAIVRVCWRIINIVPPMPLGMPKIQVLAAYAVHYLFYIFMFAMPITGWLISSAGGLPVSFFGLILLPTLIPADHATMKFLEEVHKYLAYGLIATIVLHLAAALKHHFINRDNVLKRMLP